MEFEDWPLHDAVLTQVSLDWQSGTCAIFAACFVDPRAPARPCRLEFTSVRGVSVQRLAPWGRSVHINGHRRDPGGLFEIEVQSGDLIVIDAESASFHVLA